MALHHDLLEQAQHLASRELKKPRQASLRRAVSAAYYAVFHLLAAEAAQSLAPSQPAGLRLQIRRAFVHNGMKQACERVVKGPPPAPLNTLLMLPIERDLILVARAFVALQDARHAADYDIAASFNRVYVLQLVRQARAAFVSWQAIRSQPNARVFLAALLLDRQWKG